MGTPTEVAVHRLVEWCTGEEIDPQNAMLILDIPLGINTDTVQGVLSKVEGLQNPVVVGRHANLLTHTFLALVEFKDPIDSSKVPQTITPEGALTAWRVITKDSKDPGGNEPPPLSETFEEKFAEWLLGEGKTVEDLKKLFLPPGGVPPPTPSPAPVPIMVAEPMQTPISAPAISHDSYRRLRIFSGTLPTPQGEDDWETWIDYVAPQVLEWQCSEAEK